MKRLLPLIAVLLLLPLCASAVTTVPSSVTAIGSEAFANTAIDALIIPATVKTVGANVLAGSDASYLYLKGASTTLASGANNGVPFVFGPASSSAASLSGFYAEDTLVTDSGLYYSVTDSALPLCAKNPSGLTGSVTIPKLLNGVPVKSLSVLYLDNTGVTTLRVPRYLTIPAGLNATTYQTMYIDAPVASVTETPAGRYVTWTVEAPTGAYGDVEYLWTFNVNGETYSDVTTEPTIKFAPMAEGSCTVTVTAEDSLGDTASAAGDAITVTEAQPKYRALLVGNSYPNDPQLKLDGPSTDITAMRTVLNTMTGTPYTVTGTENLTKSRILAVIVSVFYGAQPADVSLFYYSGHGQSNGSLVGDDGGAVSVYELRSALQRIPGTKIVILDSCYSGAAINRSSASPSSFNSAVVRAFSAASRSADNLEDQGYIVLTSCSMNELSVSLLGGNDHYFGVFTYGLCYGSGYDEWNMVALSGLPADTNGDKAISLGEAYTKVQERVNYIKNMAPDQVNQSVQYYGDTSFTLWSR